MFAYLRGTITQKNADSVVLEVNGVGYEVFVPDIISQRLGMQSTAMLLTYCYIREDAFTIYGFLRDEEKALFISLLGVSGIGPKAAMAVLSRMSPQEFGRAVMENDVTASAEKSSIL